MAASFHCASSVAFQGHPGREGPAGEKGAQVKICRTEFKFAKGVLADETREGENKMFIGHIDSV